MPGFPPELVGIVAGVSVSTLNMAAGFMLAKRSSTKPLKDALGIVIGGMMVRLFVVAIITWICLSVWELHVATFTLSLMISFFLMLMVETFFFHTTTKAKARTTPFVGKRRVRRSDTSLESKTVLDPKNSPK